MDEVDLILGDGTGNVRVAVKYWAGYLYGEDDTCAFCHGDPCGDDDPESPIAQFMARNKHAECCPVCGGRPA